MPPANNSLDAQVNFIVKALQQGIQKIAQASKNMGSAPAATSVKSQGWYTLLEDLFQWLEQEALMTPSLKSRSKIDTGLQIIFERPDFHFPEDYRERAKALYERFENERWGEAVVDVKVEDADSDGATTPPESPKKRKRHDSAEPAVERTGATTRADIKLPPRDDPIWGLNGIMHGIAQSVPCGGGGGSQRKTQLYDERYASEKKSAKVHGHNGIEVGSWYPRQLVACFRGAHGHLQAGIYGDEKNGAYSIVVSRTYDDLDKDNGNYLYYSAPNSHKNDDPRRSVEQGGQGMALHTSLRSGKPVRVLRSSSGTTGHSPSHGLRYGGLYRVVTLHHPKNAKGGMYEQFGLERLEDQPGIDRLRPNAQEVREFGRIDEPFWARR